MILSKKMDRLRMRKLLHEKKKIELYFIFKVFDDFILALSYPSSNRQPVHDSK